MKERVPGVGLNQSLYHAPPSNNPISFRQLTVAPSLRIVDMSDGHREIQNYGVCYHRHDLPLYEGIPSQAQGTLPIVRDPKARPRRRQLPPIAMPHTLSAASRADPSQYRVPEPSLKQAEKLVGVFDDERGTSFRPLLLVVDPAEFEILPQLCVKISLMIGNVTIYHGPACRPDPSRTELRSYLGSRKLSKAGISPT